MADADNYSPAWGDVSAWVPLHVYDARDVPNGDRVCMSRETRALWPTAPSPVARALQLKCDHCRVYMRTFDAAAERCHAMQFLTEWKSTLIAPSDNNMAPHGLGQDHQQGVYEQHTLALRNSRSANVINSVDTRPRHRRCRTIGPTSTTPSAKGSGSPPATLTAHTAATPFLEK